MPLDSVLELARHVDPRAELQNIVPLHGGFSSQAYKINQGECSFVLLVERAGGVSRSNYGHAYTVLTLLQKHDFKHAPRPLWLKSDHTALAISFFDGTASDKFNFTLNDVNTSKLAIEFIDSLLDTANIPFGEYERTAKSFNVQPVPVETPMDAARNYGIAWFDIVKKSCPDKDIVGWLESHVQQSVKIAGTIGNNPPVLGHGDPSNPNILIGNDGSFMIIDWDSARFHSTGPEFFVAYTTHLTDFMKPYRELLINHVANRLHISAREFADKVYEYRRFAEVFDINWAAMMMAKVSAGEVNGDVNHFRTIALDRIQIYETSFEH